MFASAASVLCTTCFVLVDDRAVGQEGSFLPNKNIIQPQELENSSVKLTYITSVNKSNVAIWVVGNRAAQCTF